jgi:hypothetical protein
MTSYQNSCVHIYRYVALTLKFVLEILNTFNFILNNYATDMDFAWNKVVTDQYLTYTVVCYVILTKN